MRLRQRCFCNAVRASLVIVLASVCAQAQPKVWVVPALSRVGPDDAKQNKLHIELWAGRGEYESFQVIVRGPVEELAGVEISASSLVDSTGHTISNENIRLYRERYTHITKGSPDRGGSNQPRGPGWYPDALIPLGDGRVNPAEDVPEQSGFPQVSIPPNGSGNMNQPFWVDIFVPRTAAAGEYHGAVTIADREGAASLKVTLHVWNFELPLRPSLRSAFWIFNANLEPPIFYEDREENQKVLLEHKIMPLTVDSSKEREFIDQYGLNISLLKWFGTASYGHCAQPAAPSVGDLLSLKAKHQTDLPLYLYLGDEVTTCANIFGALKAWGKNARQAGLSPMLTAVPVPELRGNFGSAGSAAGIWVLLPKQFVSNPSDVAAARSQGAEFWVYTAVVQDAYSPKWAIDFSPANYRMLGGFLSQSQGVTGLLYWAVNSWAIHGIPDRWNGLVYKENAQGIPPGEGWLVYPGEHGGFVPSIRLKWIRKSVEDFEYVELLKKTGRGDWAMQIVKTIAGDWQHWSQDAEAIEKARRELGEELDRVSTRLNAFKGIPRPGHAI